MASNPKDGFDPGWNDPPTFTYDQTKAVEINLGRKSLNKRVAFPMSGGVGKASHSIDPTAPPHPIDAAKIGTPPLGPCKPPPGLQPIDATQSKSDLSNNERLAKVLENLEPIMKVAADDEICKRFKVMEKMWLEEKLQLDVQLKLLELIEALSTGDTDSADNIQKSLMVDYVSQCSPWMSAIRHLINYKRSRNDE